MDIVEDTPQRLVIELRPWKQSLTYLAITLTFCFLVLEAFARNLDLTTTLFLLSATVILWAAFFAQAQRTRIVLDRQAGLMRVFRKHLFGQRGAMVPLSKIKATHVELIEDHQLPWKYRFGVVHSEPTQNSDHLILPAFMSRADVDRMDLKVRVWLDPSRAAA
ncbi:MAG: hypothetical protein AAF376_00505 [Pseudomonadota bacterium]